MFQNSYFFSTFFFKDKSPVVAAIFPRALIVTSRNALETDISVLSYAVAQARLGSDGEIFRLYNGTRIKENIRVVHYLRRVKSIASSIIHG